MMKVSDTGIALIKKFEGCRLKAYLCSARKRTIGYGHTRPPIPNTCTQEQADAWLREDLYDAEKAVISNVDVRLTQNQFDALCSLIFNIGVGAFQKSSLLKSINNSDPAAADQFLRWKYAGGNVSDGLISRRYAERKLFLTPDSEA